MARSNILCAVYSACFYASFVFVFVKYFWHKTVLILESVYILNMSPHSNPSFWTGKCFGWKFVHFLSDEKFSTFPGRWRRWRVTFVLHVLLSFRWRRGARHWKAILENKFQSQLNGEKKVSSTSIHLLLTLTLTVYTDPTGHLEY